MNQNTRPPIDASSFASAVQPVMADTLVITPADGLRTQDVHIATATGDLPAYLAAPAAEGPHPVVLVVQEIFGVHEHIRDVARRLAHLGCFAIAPELYFRQGDPTRAQSIEQLRDDIVSKVPDEQVLADLDATLAWSIGHGGDATRVGVTGFCWGGRITWLYAAHQPAVKAAVAWYGRLAGPSNALQPRHPLDVALSLKAPVLGLYGGQDSGIPVGQVEQMRHALHEEGSTSQIVLYPGAPHAFHADYRPSYRAEAARDGWQRLQQWFARHGVVRA